MIPNEILLIIVAAASFYLGYRMGRMSQAATMNAPQQSSPGPMADAAPLPGPGTVQPRSSPPPASAGRGTTSSPTVSPRRTTPPPPARAGLMDPSGLGKDGKKK